ncbi:hypothetical protein MJ561_01495 [Klebsiella pneumoniae]|nr:hypothetical protein MJ561_01495 [Klebsiella pneumoniae]
MDICDQQAGSFIFRQASTDTLMHWQRKTRIVSLSIRFRHLFGSYSLSLSLRYWEALRGDEDSYSLRRKINVSSPISDDVRSVLFCSTCFLLRPAYAPAAIRLKASNDPGARGCEPKPTVLISTLRLFGPYHFRRS